VAQKRKVLQTAIAFYKALGQATPETEQVMDLKGYRMFGYPAVVYSNFGLTWDVTKLSGTGDGYEVEIPFWCTGTSQDGQEKKLRRSLIVRLVEDKSAAGWAVSRFRFQGDEELMILRQFLTWFLWMLLSPFVLYALLLVFAVGFMWKKLALLVAFLMAVPLRIYASYLCFGTLWGAIGGMAVWTVFEVVIAAKRR
jgi:hypothetical protein